MAKKLAAANTVRKSARELPSASKADLDRLRNAMKGPVDTSEIPERRRFHRLKRDASGKLPSRKSVIRDAVLQQMNSLNITGYRLWRLARVHCPTLSQAAVHEFLKGRRQLELPSVEAILAAMDLRLVGPHDVGRRKKQRPEKAARN